MPTINLHGGSGAGQPGRNSGNPIDRAASMLEQMAAAKGKSATPVSDEILKASQKKAAENQRLMVQGDARLQREAFAAEKAIIADRLKKQRDISRLTIQGETRLQREALDMQRTAIRAQQAKQADIRRLTIQGETRLERETLERQRNEQRRADRTMRGAGLGAIIGAAGGGGGIRGVAGAISGGVAGSVAASRGANTVAEGIIAEIVSKIVEFSFNPIGAVQGAAQPYFDYQNSAYGLGRARGTGGDATARSFFDYSVNRGWHAPDSAGWMRDLGSTPQEAIDSLMKTGVTTGDPSNTAKNLRLLALSPGYSMLPGGSAEKMMGLQQGLGFGGAGDANNPDFKAFARVLMEANQRGFDSSKVANSMATSLDFLAQTGTLGASPGGVANFTRDMMSTGTPAGISGATALSVSQGIAANASNITGNHLATVVEGSMLSKYGNLKTAADQKRYLGNDLYNRAMSTTQGRSILNHALSAAQGGTPGLAFDLLQSMFLGGDEKRSTELAVEGVRSAFPGVPEAALPSLVGSVLGLDNSAKSRAAMQQATWSDFTPRGVRNNNPLNLKNIKGGWAGQNGTDGAFAQFDSTESGIAAGVKNMQGYPSKYGVKTLGDLIRTWTRGDSPALQASYLSDVSQRTGINANQSVNVGDMATLQRIIPAMIAHEDSGQKYGSDVVNTGISAGLQKLKLPGSAVPGNPDINKLAASSHFDSAMGDLAEAAGTAEALVGPMEAIAGLLGQFASALSSMGGAAPGRSPMNHKTSAFHPGRGVSQ